MRDTPTLAIEKPGSQRFRLPLALSCAALVLALFVPSHLALGNAGMSGLQPAHVFGTVAVVLTLACLQSLLPKFPAVALAALGLTGMFVVRAVFWGLVEFSGMGFSDEVFIHWQTQSFLVAWNEYRAWCLVAAAGLLLVAGMAWMVVSRVRWPSRRIALLLVLPLFATAMAAHRGLPEWMLIEAAQRWASPKRLDMPESELKHWRDSGLVTVDLPGKSGIVASLPAQPRNLILLYIESGGIPPIETPRYPGLMPNLQRLLRDHALAPWLHASSFITIEGIVNSQCGTLFPFERGNETMAGFDGLAEEMPCLGDVLAKAGYRQHYLGGANSHFASKGAFLRAHGYDAVKGYEYWSQHGLAARHNSWGLSDPDLFEQSLEELEFLRATGRPFNLTLLTIGTHLPGYSYEECAPYGDGSERFLNALHCTDQLLARWLEQLEKAGHLRDSVVVITGDHNIFPNPEMRELFGDAAAQDRRIPLIALGNLGDAAGMKLERGAGYDLAPTLLDLLGVEHNARFALGRSLLRPGTPRNYFPTRYSDVYEDRAAASPQGECSTQLPLPLPLNRCDKSGLMTLLRIQNTAFSRPLATLACDRPDAVSIRIPDAEDSALQFIVDGADQASTFSWKSYPVRPNQPGLWLIAFDASTKVHERRFVPADAPEAAVEDARRVANLQPALAVWRGDDDAHPAPAWLGTMSPGTRHAAALLDSNGRAVPLETHRDEHGTLTFTLDPEACTTAFAKLQAAR